MPNAPPLRNLQGNEAILIRLPSGGVARESDLGWPALSSLSALVRSLPEALTLAKALFSRVMKHRVSQQPIRFGLVTTAIGFEPRDNVGI